MGTGVDRSLEQQISDDINEYLVGGLEHVYFIYFPYIYIHIYIYVGKFIIPIDFHISQRG